MDLYEEEEDFAIFEDPRTEEELREIEEEKRKQKEQKEQKKKSKDKGKGKKVGK